MTLWCSYRPWSNRCLEWPGCIRRPGYPAWVATGPWVHVHGRWACSWAGRLRKFLACQPSPCQSRRPNWRPKRSKSNSNVFVGLERVGKRRERIEWKLISTLLTSNVADLVYICHCNIFLLGSIELASECLNQSALPPGCKKMIWNALSIPTLCKIESGVYRFRHATLIE